MRPHSDQNLLEAYLDDALTAAEVQRLDSRLNDDPALSDAFNALRTERAVRIAIFRAAAPTQHAADAFAGNLIASIRRRERKSRQGRRAGLAAGLAACLAIGFAVGWLGRGGGGPAKVANVSPTVAPLLAHGDSHRVIHTPKPAEPGQFQVAILDETGNVIAVQRFAKLEDARQFADDLGQYEVRRQQVQESQAMLVSDRF